VHVDARSSTLGEGVDLFDTRKLGFVDHEVLMPSRRSARYVARGLRRARPLGAGLDADTTRYHSIVASVANVHRATSASTLATVANTVATPASTYPRHGPVGKVSSGMGLSSLTRRPTLLPSFAFGLRRRRIATNSPLSRLVTWTTPFDLSPTSATSAVRPSTITG